MAFPKSMLEPEYDVFLCHTKKSKEYECDLFVYSLYTLFTERGGYKVFFDRVSLPGCPIETCVQAATKAKVLIAVCDDMFPSEWCTREIAGALSNNVKVQTLYVGDKFRWEDVGEPAWRMKDITFSGFWELGIDAFVNGAFKRPCFEYNRSPVLPKVSQDELLRIIAKLFTPHLSQIACGHAHSLVLNDGNPFACGFDLYKQVSDIGVSKSITQMAGGLGHSLFLREDGTVTGCGNDKDGQVSGVKQMRKVTQIAAGGSHSLFLLEDRTVMGCGLDKDDQVSGAKKISNVKQISARGNHSLFLLNDGTVKACGTDEHGQVSGADGMTGVTQISAGRFHSLFLMEDGTVKGCGLDNEGQVSGAAGITNVKKISAGGFHSLFLLEDGTVRACGYDEDGQVSGADRQTNVLDISAGGSHSLSLLENGTVAGCGNDEHGQVSGCKSVCFT